MDPNILNQLADDGVPDKPREFTQQVHERINSRLVATHVIDFGLRAMPQASLTFLAAVAGLVHYSLTGRYPKEGDSNARRRD